MSDRDYNSADLEIQLAKMYNRKPNLEQFGNTLGLAIEDNGTRPLENAARDAGMGAVTIHGREVVLLGQSRAGMSREAAEQMANDVCNRAYENASKHTAYESDRFKSALDALKSKGDELKRKTPLVTESQSVELQHAVENWRPERVKISENRGRTGNDVAPTMDQQIINALNGR